MGTIVLKYCLLISLLFICVSAKMDYCSENVFNSSLNNNYLQFTKELSSLEYSVLSSFKSLHCCAKGYRSIQWFKDGKSYPWASDMSTFILYPEAANQTIYSHSLETVDAGNYSCQIANDSHTIVHTINVNVFDVVRYSDDPLRTYDMPEEHYVIPGDSARIFCEAFIGKIDLPDAHYEIIWTRPGMNESQLLNNTRINKTNVLREDGQVIGSYFLITNVKKSDYGEYFCSISNSIDQILHMKTLLVEIDKNGGGRNFKVPWMKVLFIITTISFLIICLSTLFQFILLNILLCFKNSCQANYNDDGKMYDVLLCYTSNNDFIKTTLAITLQKKYGFSVSNKLLTDSSLASAAEQSRSILFIGSPEEQSNNEWTPKKIHDMLQYIISLNTNVIFIPLKPLPEEYLKSQDGEKLEEILKQVSVVRISGNKKSDMKLFWLKLRLALPTKNNFQKPSVAAVSSQQIAHSTNQSVSTRVNFFMLTNSKEGDEVLV